MDSRGYWEEKILGQNPKFLEALERSLAKKKELSICNQKLEESPLEKAVREKVAQL